MNARGSGDVAQLVQFLPEMNGFTLKPCIKVAAIVHACNPSTGKDRVGRITSSRTSWAIE